MQPVPEIFSKYRLGEAFDELFHPDMTPRPQYHEIFQKIAAMPAEIWKQRQEQADLMFLNQGITFTVYSSNEGTEKIFPYDLLPRIITSAEWAGIE